MAKDLDFSKFKKIFSDEHKTHLQHPKGHTIIVAHIALSPKTKEQLDKLPIHNPKEMMEHALENAEHMVKHLAEGGEAKPFHGYNPEKHSRTGGLNDSYREKYNREHGSHLKRPVTGHPEPGSEAAGRKKSFCARMKGVHGPTSEGGKLTPKGAALKRWNCHAHGGKIEDEHDCDCVHYAKGGKTEAPPVNRINMHFKDVTKRVPELTEAAKKVSAGELHPMEYDKLVNKYKPVTPYEFVPAPATAEEAMRALNEAKRKSYGKTHEMVAGEPADLRLDIPAYKEHGVWVNSIHRKNAPTVYGSHSAVKNATMIGSPEKAMKVATGEVTKSPFAVIRGEWNPMEEAEAVKKAQQFLKHKDWRQVGYDPERHGYFYDRETMEPVEGAEEVIQIGPLVLAKNPRFGKKEEQKFADGGYVPGQPIYYNPNESEEEKEARRKRVEESNKKYSESLKEQTEFPHFYDPTGEKAPKEKYGEHLYHLSQAKNVFPVLDPEYEGGGKAGRERERVGRPSRTYYYEAGSTPELIVSADAKHRYVIKRPKKIIDMSSAEGKELLQKVGNVTEFEHLIKKMGYDGYKYSEGPLPNAVALFHPQVPIHASKIKKYFAQGGEVPMQHYAEGDEVESLPHFDDVAQEPAIVKPISHYVKPLPGMPGARAPQPGQEGGEEDEGEELGAPIQTPTATPTATPTVAPTQAPASPDMTKAAAPATAPQKQGLTPGQKRVYQLYNIELASTRHGEEDIPPEDYFGPNGEKPAHLNTSIYERAEKNFWDEVKDKQDEEKQKRADFAAKQDEVRRKNEVLKRAGMAPLPMPTLGGPATPPAGAPAAVASPTPVTTPAGTQAPSGVPSGVPTGASATPAPTVIPAGPRAGGPATLPTPATGDQSDFFGLNKDNLVMQGYNQYLAGLGTEQEAKANIAASNFVKLQKNIAANQEIQEGFQNRMADLQQTYDKVAEDYRNAKIEPMALWENKSTPAKISSAIGLILGGIGGGLMKQENPALKFLQYQIDKSVEAQKANFNKYPTLLRSYMEMGQNERQAFDSARAQLATIITNQMLESANLYGDDVAKAEMQKAAGKLYSDMVVGPIGRHLFWQAAYDPNISEEKADAIMNQARTFMPDLAKELEEKRFPGFGYTNKTIDTPTQNQIRALVGFQERANYLLNKIKEAGYTHRIPFTGIGSNEYKRINAAAHDLLIELSNANGMEPTGASLEWNAKQLDDPNSLWDILWNNQATLRETAKMLKSRTEQKLSAGFSPARARAVLEKRLRNFDPDTAPRAVEGGSDYDKRDNQSGFRENPNVYR